MMSSTNDEPFHDIHNRYAHCLAGKLGNLWVGARGGVVRIVDGKATIDEDDSLASRFRVEKATAAGVAFRLEEEGDDSINLYLTLKENGSTMALEESSGSPSQHQVFLVEHRWIKTLHGTYWKRQGRSVAQSREKVEENDDNQWSFCFVDESPQNPQDNDTVEEDDDEKSWDFEGPPPENSEAEEEADQGNAPAISVDLQGTKSLLRGLLAASTTAASSQKSTPKSDPKRTNKGARRNKKKKAQLVAARTAPKPRFDFGFGVMTTQQEPPRSDNHDPVAAGAATPAFNFGSPTTATTTKPKWDFGFGGTSSSSSEPPLPKFDFGFGKTTNTTSASSAPKQPSSPPPV